jgi:DnaJ-class molecular chaperone
MTCKKCNGKGFVMNRKTGQVHTCWECMGGYNADDKIPESNDTTEAKPEKRDMRVLRKKRKN